MARRLWVLFRREIAADRTAMILVVGLTVIWNLFLLSRVGKWPRYLPMQLSVWPAFLALPWAFIGPLHKWHREWQHGSAHYTLAFPLPGWSLVLVKSATALSETAFLGVTAALAGLPVYGGDLAAQLGDPDGAWLASLFLANALKVGLLAAAVLFAVSTVIQAAYMIGRVARVWQGVIVPLAALSIAWITLRAAGFISRWLKWIPPIVLTSAGRVGRVLETRHTPLGTGPVAAVVLCGLVLAGLAAWLVDRHVDV